MQEYLQESLGRWKTPSFPFASPGTRVEVEDAGATRRPRFLFFTLFSTEVKDIYFLSIGEAIGFAEGSCLK